MVYFANYQINLTKKKISNVPVKRVEFFADISVRGSTKSFPELFSTIINFKHL